MQSKRKRKNRQIVFQSSKNGINSRRYFLSSNVTNLLRIVLQPSPAGGSFRKPTAPPLSINEKYSFFTETSVFETTKLVTRNYKMRTVLLKRKHSNEFELKPEKSKVKILNVQTITPEKRLKKLSQSKFIAPTPIKNVEEIRSQEKENDVNLQINGGEEDGKDAAGNLEVFSKDESMPVATSQSVNAEYDAKIDAGVTHQVTKVIVWFSFVCAVHCLGI